VFLAVFASASKKKKIYIENLKKISHEPHRNLLVSSLIKNPLGNDTELVAAYYQWRLWNAVTWSRYKGGVIVEKATGKSVSWPHGEESEEEEEGSEKETEESEEEEEMTAAKAAVRVE
jgi:hypothetical protein